MSFLILLAEQTAHLLKGCACVKVAAIMLGKWRSTKRTTLCLLGRLRFFGFDSSVRYVWNNCSIYVSLNFKLV